MRGAAKPSFATEAELCSTFLAAIGDDWTAYAETAGWDILLVRKADGFQIGIEAKLKLNAHVLTQALEGWEWKEHGPDCRAVLVPDGAGGGCGTIASHLALTVIGVRMPSAHIISAIFQPALPKLDDRWHRISDDWHELCPSARHALPDYVPDVAAGASAPVQLTQWKIAAIKIAVILDTRGFVTRDDFRTVKIDPRRWLDGKWLTAGPVGLLRGEGFPDFKGQHPKVYAEIGATVEEWIPAALKLEPVPQRQVAML